MTFNHDTEELIILAPPHEMDAETFHWKVAGAKKFRAVGDTHFNDVIDACVEAGIFFRFDDQQRLPVSLPADLAGVRAIVIDPVRRAEFAAGPEAQRLADFRAAGGHVFYPEVGADLDDNLKDAYGIVQEIMGIAGLTLRHPAMLAKLRAMPDDVLVHWWLSSFDAQRQVLEAVDAGWAWGDPVGYHYYWGAFEAAEYFKDPSLAEPAYAFMRAGLDRSRWQGNLNCGKRFALKFYQHTQDKDVLQRVLAAFEAAAPDLEPDPQTGVPPFVTKVGGWVNNETFANDGESFSPLSTVTGDLRYIEAMIRLGRFTHRACFDPAHALWLHRGHVDGPNYAASAPWGRGIGWMLYGIRGILEDLPVDHPARPEFCAMLAAGLEGLVRWQTPTGLWFNVLDAAEPQTRLDTCGAWMFAAVYARAYWKGWLTDPRIPELCEKAWQGLKIRLWRGLLVGQACGTGRLPARELYFGRAHTKFMFMPALHVLIELRRLREMRA